MVALKKKTKYFPKRITAIELIEEESPPKEEIIGSIFDYIGMKPIQKSIFAKEIIRRKIIELNVDLDKKEFENEVLKDLVEFLKNQNEYLQKEVSEKMDKFYVLQRKAIELQKELIDFQAKTSGIYYLGAGFGVVSFILGIALSNILFSFMGVGILITALVGIWEDKRNVQRITR